MKTQRYLSGVALALWLGTAPAGAVSLNIGGDSGLVSTEDSSSGASVSVDSDDGGVKVDADVNTELFDGDGDGDGGVDIFGGKPLLETGGDNLVTIDTDDDDDALVTLFGSPDGSAVENVAVEADVLDADRDEEVFVRLFGSGATDTTATVDLGGDATSAEVTLFGAGDSGTGTAGSDGNRAASNRGAGGENAGADDFTTASTAPAGGGGAAPAARRAAAPMPATRVAATTRSGAAGDCFSPNETQIAHLLGRSSYGPEDAEKWQLATRIEVVPVKICPDAEARLQAAIAADGDIRFLQSAVASSEKLIAQLAPHNPEDVLAVEQVNEDVTVYVY